MLLILVSEILEEPVLAADLNYYVYILDVYYRP